IKSAMTLMQLQFLEYDQVAVDPAHQTLKRANRIFTRNLNKFTVDHSSMRTLLPLLLPGQQAISISASSQAQAVRHSSW
ncbi:hypothetical protein E4U53_007202, partial [Claviceps sorghi]